MNKMLLLIRVLRKCGRAEKGDSAGSAHAGNLSELATPVLSIAFAVAMFFAGRYLAEHQAKMGSFESIFSTIMVLGCMVSFFLSIPQAINQLYMSRDLDVLITLPFTDAQIVLAKLVSVSIFPLALCCGLVVPCGLGFAITAGGFGAMYWVGLVLSAPMMALCMTSLAGIAVILLMRAFRFIRSRNVISILSTLVMFALTMSYVFMQSDLNLDQVGQTFTMLSEALSGVTKLIPVIGLSIQSMTGGGIVPLLIAAAITLALAALVFLAAKLFYFAAALGMQDANGAKRHMTDAALRKSTRASGMRKALFRREMRTILRTPSLITNGYLYSLIVPLVLVIPVGIKVYDALRDSVSEMGVKLDLNAVRMGITMLKIDWTAWALIEVFAMLFMCSLAVGMSVLSRGCISREGKDYYALKAMPVSMKTMVMIKRDIAMLFPGVSGVLFPVIIFAVCAALKLIPAWVAAASAADGIALLVFETDLCCLCGVRKPNLNWEAESDACKTNVPGLMILVMSLVVLVGVVFVISEIPELTQAAAVAMCALPVILAAVFDILLRKEAARLPERF